METTEESLIDLLYFSIAAHGFSLYLTEKIESKHKKVFKHKVKQTGKAYIKELEKSVNMIWQEPRGDNDLENSHQQATSYLLVENLLKISMNAARILSSEDRTSFENEHVELLKKYNLAIRI